MERMKVKWLERENERESEKKKKKTHQFVFEENSFVKQALQIPWSSKIAPNLNYSFSLKSELNDPEKKKKKAETLHIKNSFLALLSLCAFLQFLGRAQPSSTTLFSFFLFLTKKYKERSAKKNPYF